MTGLQSWRVKSLCVLVAGIALALEAAAGDVLVDNKMYEETGRMVLLNGEIVVHLKPKSGVAPVAAAATSAGATVLAGADRPRAAASAPKDAPAAATPDAKDPAAAAPPTTAQALAARAPPLDETTKAAIIEAVKSRPSPGLAALGVTTGALSTPSSLGELSAAIARGTDASGKVKEGVAVQFSPASLFTPWALKGGEQFESSPGVQVWGRTSVEFATAKSDDSRIGQQVALSISTGLIDRGDPRLQWRPLSLCTAKYKLRTLDPGEKYNKGEVEEYEANVEACFKDGRAEATKNLWAAPRWYAGYAKSWYTGESSKLTDSQSGPTMLWTSYSQGYEMLNPQGAVAKTLLEFAASRKQNLIVKDPVDATKLVTESRTDVNVRLRMSRSLWSAYADAGLANVRTAGVLSENVRRFGYGVEYKVSDGIWLVLASVTERGFVSGEKRTLLNTGLRFGQTDKDIIGIATKP